MAELRKNGPYIWVTLVDQVAGGGEFLRVGRMVPRPTRGLELGQGAQWV